MHYHLNPDSTYLLYSIGMNGTDDGGDASEIPPPPKLSLHPDKALDIVWPQRDQETPLAPAASHERRLP